MADTYVNGRKAVLQALDSLLAEEHNIKAMKSAFQASIDENALGFFKIIVMPLLPKQDDEELTDKTQTVSINIVPATAITVEKK